VTPQEFTFRLARHAAGIEAALWTLTAAVAFIAVAVLLASLVRRESR
jgi:hypothetical protein